MDLTGEDGCNSPSNQPGTQCKTRIWFSRSTNNGDNWENPKQINRSQSLNDQFHPRLAVDETNGQLVVVYYDTVDDPNRHRTNVWMQTSEDNGTNWSIHPIKVTTAQTDETIVGANGHRYGDYIGLTG
jgi:Neuraminidase (sialidase)